jgi:hypothetical protein
MGDLGVTEAFAQPGTHHQITIPIAPLKTRTAFLENVLPDAKKVLVLTAHEPPKDHFTPIWQGLPQWPYVQKELLKSLAAAPKPVEPPAS